MFIIFDAYMQINNMVAYRRVQALRRDQPSIFSRLRALLRQPLLGEMDPTASAKPCVCSFCQEEFASKTKLFKHLQSHGYTGPNAKPDRVILLVGWLADNCGDNDEWTIDMGTTSTGREIAVDAVETALYRAVYCIENNLQSVDAIPADMVFERPKGSSRASSIVQRSALLLGIEASCHGLCDTFCLNIRPYAKGSNEDWINQVNTYLPPTIRVLHKITLSSEMAPKELHAEVSCTQYRYEYMLPLRLLMAPPSTGAMQMDGSVASGEGEGDTEGVNRWLQQAVTRRKVFHPSEKNKSNGFYSMDQKFPIETAEGQRRVAFFRNLKRISKNVAGRKPFHNFASGGASPEDTVSVRKIDRIYHKELVSIGGEPWVVFSVSGDGFLRGQVRRVLGVMVAVARGLLPESYIEACLGKTAILDVPALPGWGLYLAECKYAYYEAKFEDFRLDPRRIPGSDCSRMDAWKAVIHGHIAQICKNAGDSWLGDFDRSCSGMWQRHQQMHALMSRPRSVLEQAYEQKFGRKAPMLTGSLTTTTTSASTPEATLPLEPPYLQQQREGGNPVDSTVPAVYAKVLRLLQEADASGLWPANSTGRQKVILNAPAVLPTAASDSDLQDTAAATEASGMDEEVHQPVEQTASDKGEEIVEPEKQSKNNGSGKGTSKGSRRGKNNNNRAKKSRVERTEEPSQVEERAEYVTDLNESEDAHTTPERSHSPSPDQDGERGTKAPLQPAHRRAETVPVELVSDAGVGGSFSVGCLPKHLAQPKGNALFPELMMACFELERALCPDRPPSSTIAINRHAQFSPHRDSGAGSGQSQSLIVALGDFVGGEIAVEGTAHDIRYRPLEFDGWLQRHWTLPFVGQRYSLVWFTPLGITEEDLWWWKK